MEINSLLSHSYILFGALCIFASVWMMTLEDDDDDDF